MSLPADQKLRGRLRSHIQFSQLRRPNFLRKKSCLILTPLGFAFHAPNDFPHCFAIQIELPGDRWQRETVDSSRIDSGVALRLAVEVHVEYHNFVICSAYAIGRTQGQNSVYFVIKGYLPSTDTIIAGIGLSVQF
jgi:hypothetical protein